MRRAWILLAALGCGDEPELLIDTSEPFVEEDLDASCEGVQGTWEATGLDAVAVEGDGTASLGDDTLLLTLDEDGTWSAAHLTDAGLSETEGSWELLDDDRMQIDPFFAGLSEPVTLSCRRDGDRLSLYGTGPYTFADESPEEAQLLVTLARVRGGTTR